MATTFKSNLASVIFAHLYDTAKNVMSLEEWRLPPFQLAAKDQCILDEAFLNSPQVQEKLCVALKDLPVNIVARSKKTIARVLQKNKERAGDEMGNFKVISDWLAFRIICSIDYIPIVEKLLSETFDFFITKDACFGPDIVSYSFAYSVESEFLIELQVGHPFAGYVFKMDSYLRDHGTGINLWNQGFYAAVKAKILNPGLPNDLQHRLMTLCKDQKMAPDAELLQILKNIEVG